LDPAVLQQARRDVEYAGLLLRFHGAYGRHLTNAITDNQARLEKFNANFQFKEDNLTSFTREDNLTIKSG
jgi:hypothetical protein